MHTLKQYSVNHKMRGFYLLAVAAALASTVYCLGSSEYLAPVGAAASLGACWKVLAVLAKFV